MVSWDILGFVMASMASYGEKCMRVKHRIVMKRTMGMAVNIRFNIYLAMELSPYKKGHLPQEMKQQKPPFFNVLFELKLGSIFKGVNRNQLCILDACNSV
jgi:hypothetical protein